MSRTWVCAVIVAVTALTSVLTLGALESSTEGMLELIDRVIASAEDGSAEETEKALSELERGWQEHYFKLSFLVQSGPLRDISYNTAKLRGLYEKGADDFIAECEGIRKQVQQVLESQHILSAGE